MELQHLGPLEAAPDESDHIKLEKLASGQFRYSGVVVNGSVHDHFVAERDFDNLEEALVAGIAVARERGAAHLVIEYPHPKSTA